MTPTRRASSCARRTSSRDPTRSLRLGVLARATQGASYEALDEVLVRVLDSAPGAHATAELLQLSIGHAADPKIFGNIEDRERPGKGRWKVGPMTATTVLYQDLSRRLTPRVPVGSHSFRLGSLGLRMAGRMLRRFLPAPRAQGRGCAFSRPGYEASQAAQPGQHGEEESLTRDRSSPARGFFWTARSARIKHAIAHLVLLR